MSYVPRHAATAAHGRVSPSRWRSFSRIGSSGLTALALSAMLPPIARAQRDSAPPPRTELSTGTAKSSDQLDSLVVEALVRGPKVRAASARAVASRHRVSAAAAPPDPMLMLGIQNQPLGRERGTMAGMAPSAGPDPMTMRMAGMSQTIPFPGKLALRRRVAEREVESAEAALETARRQIVRDVKQAYYELAFLDRALEVTMQSRDVVAAIVRAADARYGSGGSTQSEVIRSRLDATRLAESASALAEQRRATLAGLNALLGRVSDAPVGPPAIPAGIAQLAIPVTQGDIRFVSNALGARVAGSPLRPLAELQELAVANNSELREHQATIAAQAVRVDLARRDRRPDVDVALQYGQRGGGLPDMVSASISIPLPVFARRKQNALALDAESELHALQAEHEASANALRAQVASLVADLERQRTQLALLAKALLPQGRAQLAASTGSYQVGKAELRDVLEARSALFTYDVDNARALTDFAKQLAELERVVGTEVVR
jgi:cobalt-zinc-cadmium efflux system outer membrane protein